MAGTAGDARGASEKSSEELAALSEAEQDSVFTEAFGQAETAAMNELDVSAADDPAKMVDDAGTAGTSGIADQGSMDEQSLLGSDVLTGAIDAGTAGTAPAEADPSARQPGETAEDYKQRWQTLQGIHRHDKEAWEAEKAQLLSDLQAARGGNAGTAGTTADASTAGTSQEEIDTSDQALMDSLTSDQKEALKTYNEEFDVVSKMEGLKRDSAMRKLRGEIKSFMDEIRSQLAPATALVKQTEADQVETEREAHLQAIRDAHGDFETYRDNGSVLKWIGTLPKYLQPSALATYNQGEAGEIIDLLTDFKRANNISYEPPKKSNGNVDAEREARRMALMSPVTRRGPVNARTGEASGYEEFFDEAAART